MLNDKVTRTAFLISFIGHCLFLSAPGFNSRLPAEVRKPKEITVSIEIEKPSLLPKIDIVGEEKRFKEVVEKQPEFSLRSQLQPKEIAIEEIPKEPIEEKIEVINPAQEVMLPRYQKSFVELSTENSVINPAQEAVQGTMSCYQKPFVELSTKDSVINPAQEVILRYQDMVKQRIEKVKRYPSWAKRQGIEGTVYLSFTILSNGTSQDIKIVRPSGFKILDDEAVTTIQRANPFPPIPKEIGTPSVQMEVSIVFTTSVLPLQRNGQF